MADLVVQVFGVPIQGNRVSITGPAGFVDPRFQPAYSRWHADVPPGEYVIAVSRVGYREEKRTVAVPPRGAREVFHLVPQDREAFGVLFRDGNWVPYARRTGLLGLYADPAVLDDQGALQAFVELATALAIMGGGDPGAQARARRELEDRLPPRRRGQLRAQPWLGDFARALGMDPDSAGRVTERFGLMKPSDDVPVVFVPWDGDAAALARARSVDVVAAAGPAVDLPSGRIAVLTQVAHVKLRPEARRGALARAAAALDPAPTQVRRLPFGVNLYALEFAPEVGEELPGLMETLISAAHGIVLSADVALVAEMRADAPTVAEVLEQLGDLGLPPLDTSPPSRRIKVAVLDRPGSFRGLDQIGLGDRLLGGRVHPDGRVVNLEGAPREKGHGVACASVLGAPAVALGYRGVAPDAEIMPVRIYSTDLETNLATLRWIAGVEDYATASDSERVDVISCSVGIFGAGQLGVAEKATIEAIATQGRAGLGCVIVCSAGNEGLPVSEGRPLAASPYAIACGACFDTEAATAGVPMYELAPYSGTGVDLCAPSTETSDNSDAPLLLALGQPADTEPTLPAVIAVTEESITFAGPHGLAVDDVLLVSQGSNAWAWRVAGPSSGAVPVKPIAEDLDTTLLPSSVSVTVNTALQAFGATSAAAPAVAGVAALLLSTHPDLSAAEVHAALKAGASRAVRTAAGEQPPADGTGHPILGAGRVQAAASISAVGPVADRPALSIDSVLVRDPNNTVVTTLEPAAGQYSIAVTVRNGGGAVGPMGDVRVHVADITRAYSHPAEWAASNGDGNDGDAWEAGVYALGAAPLDALAPGDSATVVVPWVMDLLPSWDRCVVLAEIAPQTGAGAGQPLVEDNPNLSSYAVEIAGGVAIVPSDDPIDDPEDRDSPGEPDAILISPHSRVIIRLTEFRLLRSHDFDGRDDIVLSCTVKTPDGEQTTRFPEAGVERLAAGQAWRPADALLLDASLTSGSAVILEFSCVDRDWVFHDDLGSITGRLVSGFAGWAGEHVPARTPDVQWTVRYAVEVITGG